MRGKRQIKGRGIWLGVTAVVALGTLCGSSSGRNRAYAATGHVIRHVKGQMACCELSGAGGTQHQELYYSSGGILRVSGMENGKENAGVYTEARMEASPPAATADTTAEPTGTASPAETTEQPKGSAPPEAAGKPQDTIKPKATVRPTVTPGRLVHKKYTTWYVYKGGRKLTKSFLTLKKKTYYFDKSGDMYHGWLKRGGEYYYLDRSTGVLVHHGKVDGIRLRKGQAVQTKRSVKKIETMRTAARLLKQITKPSDTREQKKMKCYRYIMKCDYRRYRFLEPIYKKKGWECTFANDIFRHHAGCCVSESSALAFLFHEIGYKDVYVCHDTSHAWVEMNGRVYDNLFSKAKDFWKYYNATYESFGLNPVDKRKI